LWNVGLRDELEGISKKLAAQGFWRDGWLAVKQTRFFDEKDKASENYARLSRLEEALKPRDLVQRVRGRVLASKGAFYDVDEVDADDADRFRIAMEKKQAEAKTLGIAVANDPAALHELLPEIVSGAGNLWHFGTGLANGSKDTKELWQQMLQEFERTPLENRDIRAFCGMLFELNINKSDLPDELLDDALANQPLASYFPTLQAAVNINPRGMARLIKSLELGNVPIHEYANIHLGRTIEVVTGKDIAKYIRTLASAQGGETVAIHVLSMQFFSDRQDKRAHAPEIVAAGCELLRHMEFDHRNQREDYHLRGVVEVCLAGVAGYDVAKAICENLKRAATEYRAYGFDHKELLQALFKIQPRAALDAFLTGDDEENTPNRRTIARASYLHQNPLDQVSEAALFEWCGNDPTKRFPAVAAVVSGFTLSSDHNPSGWAPIASRLVHSAPDPIAVMRELIEQLRPMAWSGSRSAILQKNMTILDAFDVEGNMALAAFIQSQKASIQREAQEYREWETKQDRDRDERFE
jgi:hypothetical protein